MAGGIEAWQVVGVVAEVGVHLEDVAVVAFQSPLESGDIGRAKSQFSASFHDEEAALELVLHQVVDNVGRTVGTAIVDDQDVKVFLQAEDGSYDLLYVLLLVVRRDDDDAVALLHNRLD